MARILFLAHRIPYPPNKGDKIRSWHFLKHLFANHDVHVGFYVDQKADLAHIDIFAKLAKSVCVESVDKRWQKIRAVSGLLDGRPLTLSAYPAGRLRAYAQKLLGAGEVDLVFLSSGATGPIVDGLTEAVATITDLVDVDSAKWAMYAPRARWPMSWIYRRESVKLAVYEQALAAQADATLLVSEKEAVFFRAQLQPDVAHRVIAVRNGVDLDYFDPARVRAKENDTPEVIFTGAMDYAPNIEAAIWFVRQVWPTVRASVPDAIFTIAGGPRTSAVNALAREPGVRVLGYVDDMAESIAGAQVVVAPLLTARGIQNKVLEGMAMKKAVVATSGAHEGIEAEAGQALLVADDATAFAFNVARVLENPPLRQKLGDAARDFVCAHHCWQNVCENLDQVIETALRGNRQ
ncbi:TIGR03087 family PEP-CTERM/XrtA system glycosyltransferase [Kordiimonas aestuarii]|uniref:TIGR03087 family PEP-CTERM/XrtA system glycosyltransferase n=1 Tax=Kordiimonas aestuarii TaxID=1005925 RepID=UPI0021D1D3BE|nr:TIGR03087 family PEP-CTERM/XrtA system glycosyltransferase [Kordiimonas aestuarii]